MITHSDLPTWARLQSRSGVKAVHCQPGKLPIDKYIAAFKMLSTTSGEKINVMRAEPGSGKSRVLPEVCHKIINKKLLVLTPGRVDLPNMQRFTKCKSSFKMGGGVTGGCEEWESDIVFCTIGLAEMNYASEGPAFLANYGGILLDELEQAETSPAYALILEVVLKYASATIGATDAYGCSGEFKIFGCSAAFSDEMTDALTKIGTSWTTCMDRAHSLERYFVNIPTHSELAKTMTHIAHALWKRQQTCLVFVQGKTEITDIVNALVALGVPASHVTPLHADLDPDEFINAAQEYSYAKVYVSTSVAQRAITIPSVDFVIDCGLVRSLPQYHELVQCCDLEESDSIEKQRAGRVGRVKAGCVLRMKCEDAVNASDKGSMSLEDWERVVVLQSHHYRIPATALRVCPGDPEQIHQIKQSIIQLAISDYDLFRFVLTLPFSMRDAAVFIKALALDVAYEATAVLAFRIHCRFHAASRFNAEDIVKAITIPTYKVKSMLKVTRLAKAQLLFNHVKRSFNLVRSRWKGQHIEEAMSVAFLVCPERLIAPDMPCYMGDKFVDCTNDDYFTAVVFSNNYSGLQCVVHLIVTQWVLTQTRLQKWSKTCKVISDSTLDGFRSIVCYKMRMLGYDVKAFICKGGKTESQVAIDIMLTPFVDLAIAIPNGNGLCKHPDDREPSWMDGVCRELATSLHCTARHAVVFFGDIDLSPLLADGVYPQLVPMMQGKLRHYGVPVVTRAPGVILKPDRIHWSVVSAPAVETLMNQLVLKAQPVNKFHHDSVPSLWKWRLNKSIGLYFPTCLICNIIAYNDHVGSKKHLENASGTRESFEFANREGHCNKGVNFRRANPSESRVWLPAYTPLPLDAPKTCPGSGVKLMITEFEVRSETGPIACRKDLPKRISCHFVWNDDSEAVYDFEYHASGRKRDVYDCMSQSWSLKVQLLDDSKSQEMGAFCPNDYNLKEWDKYNKIGVLQDLVPTVSGYKKGMIGQRVCSVLLVDRVGFTFHSFVRKVTMNPRWALRSIMVIINTIIDVFQLMKECARKGLVPNDWHTRNIGVIDDHTHSVKCLDWEDTDPAAANHSYQGRVNASFERFLNGIPGFASTCCVPRDAPHRHLWIVTLGALASCCRTWWKDWRTEFSQSDAMPNQLEFSKLFIAMEVIAVDASIGDVEVIIGVLATDPDLEVVRPTRGAKRSLDTSTIDVTPAIPADTLFETVVSFNSPTVTSYVGAHSHDCEEDYGAEVELRQGQAHTAQAKPLPGTLGSKKKSSISYDNNKKPHLDTNYMCIRICGIHMTPIVI